MEITYFLKAVFALAITLGLIGAAAVALRKWGPEALARYANQKKERRLKLVETLVIDPARRLVIFEIDGREQLLLLGEGRLLGDVKEARK
jgi:flagellar protein FliO/FliZ